MSEPSYPLIRDNHAVYLVRLWQNQADQSWRYAVQSPATGERFVFSTLDEFFVFFLRISQMPAVSSTEES